MSDNACHPGSDFPVSSTDEQALLALQEGNDMEEMGNNLGGWVKLYRRLRQDPKHRDPEYMWLWVVMLLKATHQALKVDWCGQPLILQPGEFISSHDQLALESGVNREKVRRVLARLQTDKQIDRQVGNLSTVFTIRNWERYQSTDRQVDTLPTGHRQATDRPPTPNKNEENIRTEEVTPPIIPPKEGRLQKPVSKPPEPPYEPSREAIEVVDLFHTYLLERNLKIAASKVTYRRDCRIVDKAIEGKTMLFTGWLAIMYFLRWHIRPEAGLTWHPYNPQGMVKFTPVYAEQVREKAREYAPLWQAAFPEYGARAELKRKEVELMVNPRWAEDRPPF